MGKVGRKHIEENYNISTLNKELEKIFEHSLCHFSKGLFLK